MPAITDLVDARGDVSDMSDMLLSLSLEKAFRPPGAKAMQLLPGMVLIKRFLSPDQQSKIVAIVQAVSMEGAGFTRPRTSGGHSMHLDMLHMGRTWKHGSGYLDQSPDGSRTPPIPEDLSRLAQDCVQEAATVDFQLPASFSPDLCLANYYSHGGRLGMHQDKDESKDSLSAGLPVVSLSIGDSCEFAYAPVPKKTVNRGDGEEFPGEKTVKLESGDLLVFGGPSRLVFHGVRRVMSNTKPKGVMMRPGRLNLTFRQFSMK